MPVSSHRKLCRYSASNILRQRFEGEVILEREKAKLNKMMEREISAYKAPAKEIETNIRLVQT